MSGADMNSLLYMSFGEHKTIFLLGISRSQIVGSYMCICSALIENSK